MAEHRHLIKRLVLEVKTARAWQSDDFESELGRICRKRIIPIIERACTQLGDPDRLHRIESLELDLDRVDVRHLETDLVAKLARMLPRALTEQISSGQETGNRASEGGEKSRSRIEMLAMFARTGTLPWWADATVPDLLNTVIDDQLRVAPGALIPLMRELTTDRRHMKRIIVHCSDKMLSAILHQFIPDIGAESIRFALELGHAIDKGNLSSGKTGKEINIKIWQGIMQTVCRRPHPFENREQYRTTVLKGIAAEFGVTYAVLVTAFHQWLEHSSTDSQPRADDELRQSIAHLSKALSPEAAAEQKKSSRIEQEIHQALADAARCMKDSGDRAYRLIEYLHPVMEHLPHSMMTRFIARLQSAIMRKAGTTGVDEIIPFLQSVIKQDLEPRAVLQRLSMALGEGKLFDGVSEERAGLEKVLRNGIQKREKIPNRQEESPPDLYFSDSDDLYIDNSGLVILWPFLDRFFNRLNLMHAKRFVSDNAMHRAVGLLQYLATEERSAPEYQLPLNKVLCGMDLTQVFVFTEPVSDEEARECTQLLEAVIDHAPILKQMSVTGFRGSFLLRKGMLGIRDGAWLLRVERQSYDVVLDRFPWDFGWVKLPWMEAPLRVER